jgi:hypothetical protein
VVVHPAFAYVCSVAVEWEPEIFDEIIAECFEDPAIELVPGGVRCPNQRKSV